MPKKILSLGTDGKLVLKLPGGGVEPLPETRTASQTAFLLVDCSGSMGTGTKLEQARSGASAFALDAFGQGYSVGLIQFSDEATLLCAPTRDISDLRIPIKNLTIGGGTNMTHALQLAMDKLSLMNGLRAIVVVTDGIPDSRATALNMAQRAKEKGIEIIPRGTDDADQDFLNQLASRPDLAVKVSREMFAQSIASAAKMLPGSSR